MAVIILPGTFDDPSTGRRNCCLQHTEAQTQIRALYTAQEKHPEATKTKKCSNFRLPLTSETPPMLAGRNGSEGFPLASVGKQCVLYTLGKTGMAGWHSTSTHMSSNCKTSGGNPDQQHTHTQKLISKKSFYFRSPYRASLHVPSSAVLCDPSEARWKSPPPLA